MEKLASRLARHSTVKSFQASDASQSILTLDSETDKPVDFYNLIAIILCFFGIGSMISIITLFAAPDYLQLQLDLASDQQILYFITPTYILPNLIITIVMIRYGYYPSFQHRIVTCFIITAACLIAIPILFLDSVSNIFGYKLIFYIILLLSSMIGITSSILSISIIAFCQFFPIKYLRTLVIGQSIALVLICMIRIGIKLLFGLEAGGVIYFSISAAINILCAILFLYIITYSPFVAYYIHPYLASKDRRIIERKIKQIEENNQQNTQTHNTKTDSRSIRNSVAIIPSHLSYFSNIKQFKQFKAIGKQHPNSPQKHKQSSPLQQQINNNNIFYENENNNNNNKNNVIIEEENTLNKTLSMPTKSILKKDKKHKRTRSNTDNDIHNMSSIDDLELKQHANNLNDLSLSNYSIQSQSINMMENEYTTTHTNTNTNTTNTNTNSSNAASQLLQPNTIKSALLISNKMNSSNHEHDNNNLIKRDHAKSEIVVYPTTYVNKATATATATAYVSPPNNLNKIDMGHSPQSPLGYQFNYNPYWGSSHHPSMDSYQSLSAFAHAHGRASLKYEYGLVAKKIFKSIWCLFITFFVTYLVFPGLILDFKSQYQSINHNDWFPVILITEFCICDLLGRQLNILQTFHECGRMNILSSLRILLYPVFIVLDQQLLNDDNIIYILVGLCAFTNGFFVCAAFVNVPMKLYPHEQEIGAAFMQLASTLSVLASSLIALAVYEVLNHIDT